MFNLNFRSLSHAKIYTCPQMAQFRSMGILGRILSWKCFISMHIMSLLHGGLVCTGELESLSRSGDLKRLMWFSIWKKFARISSQSLSCQTGQIRLARWWDSSDVYWGFFSSFSTWLEKMRKKTPEWVGVTYVSSRFYHNIPCESALGIVEIACLKVELDSWISIE